MSDPSTIVEQRDALEHLAAAGFSRLLAVLQDPGCYTRAGRGRVLLAAVARRLGVTPRRAAAMLAEARAALAA